MRLRALAVFQLLLALTCWLGSGCGSAADPQNSATHMRAELAQARSQVQAYAELLAGAVEHASTLSRTPAVFGSYQPCRAGEGFITYRATITITADGPATMAEMNSEIVALLRSQGWSLVNVDFAKVHLGLADTDHPVYDMRQHEVKGAANILTYKGNSAGALIFMNAPCIDAGSLATQIERSGHL